jgi:hypothetical protein
MADVSLQLQIFADARAQGTPLLRLATTHGLPAILKVARTVNAAVYVHDRVGVIRDEVSQAGIQLPPLLSKEIGTGMQLADNLYPHSLALSTLLTRGVDIPSDSSCASYPPNAPKPVQLAKRTSQKVHSFLVHSNPHIPTHPCPQHLSPVFR